MISPNNVILFESLACFFSFPSTLKSGKSASVTAKQIYFNTFSVAHASPIVLQLSNDKPISRDVCGVSRTPPPRNFSCGRSKMLVSSTAIIAEPGVLLVEHFFPAGGIRVQR